MLDAKCSSVARLEPRKIAMQLASASVIIDKPSANVSLSLFARKLRPVLNVPLVQKIATLT